MHYGWLLLQDAAIPRIVCIADVRMCLMACQNREQHITDAAQALSASHYHDLRWPVYAAHPTAFFAFRDGQQVALLKDRPLSTHCTASVAD